MSLRLLLRRSNTRLHTLHVGRVELDIFPTLSVRVALAPVVFLSPFLSSFLPCPRSQHLGSDALDVSAQSTRRGRAVLSKST